MRKTRSDCTVGSFEKRNGFALGTFRHPSGRDMRSDKTFGALRKENKDKKELMLYIASERRVHEEPGKSI